MRGKRSKQYRKLMQQYGLHFGFREPYQVLLDAAILQDAARFKMDFLGGLERTLHGEVKPMITQCCIRHLYTSEPKGSSLLEHVKAFERRRCNHHTLDQPLTALECISSVVDPKSSRTNKHRYIVASQDMEVRGLMRKIPGVPLIYLKRSVMIMEPMAGATEQVRDREEKAKFRAGLRGSRVVGVGAGQKRGRGEEEDNDDSDDDIEPRLATTKTEGGAEPAKKKRKRGPSGPNPLSIKKAKKEDKPVRSLVKSEKAPIVAEAVKSLPASAAQVSLDEVAKRKRKRKHKSGKDDEPVSGVIGGVPLTT